MSRFTGWSAAAVERINREKTDPGIVKARKKLIRKDYPGMIAEALKLFGIECQREYKFLHDRRFRFDLVVLPVSNKIAVEFEGDIYNRNSGHTSSRGYIKDVKKYNLANMYGWKLIRFTTADTKANNWDVKAATEIVSFMKILGESR